MQHYALVACVSGLLVYSFQLGFTEADLRRKGKTDLAQVYRHFRRTMFFVALFMMFIINPL
jgi:hypothetical protein